MGKSSESFKDLILSLNNKKEIEEEEAKVKEALSYNSKNITQDTQVTLVDYSRVRLTHWQKRRKKKMWKYSLEGDKKFRGPLSLFVLRVFGWICIILSQVAFIFNTASDLAKMPIFAEYGQIISIFSSLSMPAFLLANFAYIIQNKQDIYKVLITYFFMMVIIAGAFYLLYEHYIVGIFALVLKIDTQSALEMLTGIISKVIDPSFKFNIFVDLFICTLFVYFFLATPKRLFKGKKIIFFRMMAVIPLLYELTTISLKIAAITGEMSLPLLLTPFMPTKCPMTFLAFVLIVLFEAKRKRKFLKYNKTKEDYALFFKTNKNSWLFAKSTAKSFAFVGLFDVILALTLYVLQFALVASDVQVIDVSLITNTINYLEIGESAGLLLMSPLILLFSYNKMFKPSKMDVFLPVLSIIVIIILYLEAIFLAIKMYV